MASLKSSPAWKALEAHHQEAAGLHMRDLFADDAGRFERFSIADGDLFLDYSKNRITDETTALLVDLARAADVEGWRDRMISGDIVNVTEGRAAGHTALRDPGADGDIQAALDRMRQICEGIVAGKPRPVRTVVSIGTGGSHLGPALVSAALAAYGGRGPDVRFLANVDGAAITRALDGLDAAETLFIVVSKTFTTEETLVNALTARQWLADALGEAAIKDHFIAVTADAGKAADFGVDPDNVIPVWNWVGGRFSLWSAVGLAAAIAVGMDNFEKLLAGAHAMDRHFAQAPLAANMPVVLALVALWNIDFLGARALAVLPYDEGLSLLPAYLQQLEMESNGKSAAMDGGPVDAGTAPVVFGAAGTGGQHAFYQAIHQGRDLIACDFIAAAESHTPTGDHHARLLANCLAQSEALMLGQPEDEARARLEADGHEGNELERLLPQCVFEGNRPSNTLLMPRVTPFALGQLLALYEHKVFVQGVLWGINPFDQWGVEMGKVLAAEILPAFTGMAGPDGRSSSTTGLIGRLHAMKANKP